MRIEWDAAKDRANRLKHAVGFDEARTLFEGEGDYLVVYDREHSDDEDRFLAIGPIASGVVVVWYVEPAEDVIRIIGARMATRAERRLFYERTRGSSK